LERFLGELTDGEARISHRWAGIFALTQDMLPLVGRVPGHEDLWIAAGYSGHGNVMGFGCGRLVADAMLGERPELLGLFDPRRLRRRLRALRCRGTTRARSCGTRTTSIRPGSGSSCEAPASDGSRSTSARRATPSRSIPNG